MKTLLVIAITILIVPILSDSMADDCSQSGTTLYWYGKPFVLPEGNIPIRPGETLSFTEASPGECLVICFESPAGDEYLGSLAIGSEDGWTYNEDFGICWYIQSDGCYYWYFDITCPLNAKIGTINTVYLVTTYCNPVTCELDPALATDTLVAYFEVVSPDKPPKFQKGKKMQ
jgi:hypothetical protein